MKILVIDEDPTICTCIKAWLEARGDEVITTALANRGLHLLLTEHIPILILSSELVEMSTREFLWRCRQQTPLTRIILMGPMDYDELVFALQGRERSLAQWYLSKPLNQQKLVEAVARLQQLAERVRLEELFY